MQLTKYSFFDTPTGGCSRGYTDVPEAILDVPEAIMDVPESILDVPEAMLV